MRTCFAVAVAFAALMFAGAAEAEPSAQPLTICNQYSEHIRVAYGYYSSGVNDTNNVLSGPFVSRGWWFVEPGQCRTFENPFSARYMYWFAWAHGIHDSMDAIQQERSSSDLHFCITNYFGSATTYGFTFEDENVDSAACDRVTSPQPALWVVPHKVDTVVDPQVTVMGP
jgi:uncharacterized membrane protein